MEERKKIIEGNMRLVHACANRFKGKGIEYDDLFQNGCVGLVKAADSFDKNRGVQFSTYAVPFILGEIKRLFREGGVVKVSRRVKDLSLKINRYCESFAAKNGKSPTVSEIAEEFNIDVQQVVEALDSSRMPVSLTSPQDSEESQIDIPVDFNDESISNKITITNILATMSKEDRNLIYIRFFKCSTQTQTAKVLGKTQVQISRREKVLLKFMREKMA